MHPNTRTCPQKCHGTNASKIGVHREMRTSITSLEIFFPQPDLIALDASINMPDKDQTNVECCASKHEENGE